MNFVDVTLVKEGRCCIRSVRRKKLEFLKEKLKIQRILPHLGKEVSWVSDLRTWDMTRKSSLQSAIDSTVKAYVDVVELLWF